MQILYESGVCCQAQPMFEKTVHKQKHPRVVDKCINSLPHNFCFDTKSLLSMPGTGQPVPGKGRPTSRPPLAPSVRHLSFSVANDKYIYENVYFAEISTCFAMGAFISSITSTSVLVHLIYTCGAIHTRITCTFVSIWEIRFEHALF